MVQIPLVAATLLILTAADEHNWLLILLLPVMVGAYIVTGRIRCPHCHQSAFSLSIFSSVLWPKRCANCGESLSAPAR
jgi:hypothetical protein